MAETTLSDFLRPFTTNKIDAGTLGKIVKGIEIVLKEGYGSVTITICESKIKEIEIVIKDRDIRNLN